MPFYIKLNIQDYSNKSMINIHLFNDELNLIICLILTVIMYSIVNLFITRHLKSVNIRKERTSIEIFWTISPSLIIIIMSIPSIISLYIFEEVSKPNNYIFISGNQWYWSYSIINKRKTSAYIYPNKINRNLTTDYSIILPINKVNRLIIRSNDVIHSWTIPSRITKIDCIPGRINSINIETKKIIKMKGQCSEICGSNHRFIPISILSISSS